MSNDPRPTLLDQLARHGFRPPVWHATLLMNRPTGQRSTYRVLIITMGATVVGVLPVFLTGALAVELTRELAFEASGLGLAVSAFRLSAASSSGYFGKLTDRFGATMSLRIGVTIASTAALGIAVLANSWAGLVAFMLLAGTAQAFTQPAANRMLINRIRPERRGIAFGFKQSGPPVASALAGVSIPVIAVVFGWRWAYVLVPVFALLVLLLIGRGRRGGTRRRNGQNDSDRSDVARPRRSTIVLLMLAFGLGTAASGTVPAFYVAAAVRGGTANEVAGTLLAAASAAAIGVRLLAGVICDRMVRGHMRICAVLLGTGSAGIFLLAAGTPGAMGGGVILALAGTWGFNGVFWYALMRAYSDAPGTITGAVAPGGLIGGIIGPSSFGFIVDAAGYPLAWVFGGVLALAASAMMVVGSKRLASRRA